MDAGELWTRWTVRVAMLLYVLSLALHGRSLRWSRLAWTGGCAAYLLHVICAFTFYHHGSHANAYAATARQTEAVVGWNWGGGLYANYAFTLVWIADVCRQWMKAERIARNESATRWLAWGVQGFMGFIAFNATVVFASGAVRWGGILGVVLLTTVWVHALLGSRSPGPSEPDDKDVPRTWKRE